MKKFIFLILSANLFAAQQNDAEPHLNDSFDRYNDIIKEFLNAELKEALPKELADLIYQYTKSNFHMPKYVQPKHIPECEHFEEPKQNRDNGYAIVENIYNIFQNEKNDLQYLSYAIQNILGEFRDIAFSIINECITCKKNHKGAKCECKLESKIVIFKEMDLSILEAIFDLRNKMASPDIQARCRCNGNKSYFDDSSDDELDLM